MTKTRPRSSLICLLPPVLDCPGRSTRTSHPAVPGSRPNDGEPGGRAPPVRGTPHSRPPRARARSNHGAIRTAGVSPLRSGMSTTNDAAVNSCRPLDDAAVGVDEARDAVGGGYGDLATALHRPGPGDGELLLDLPGAAVGGVVALHHQHLSAAPKSGVDRRVVGQLEADDVADLDGPAVQRNRQHPWCGAGDRLGADLLEDRDQRQQLGAERDPLAERDQVALVVAGQDAAHRVPPQGRGLAFVGTRSLHHRADQDRATGDRGRGLDGTAGDRVERGVDVGRVLRPEDEVGHRDQPQSGLDHQVDGLAQVVVGDRPHPAESLDPPARDVALHDADVHASRRSPAARGTYRRPAPSSPAPRCRRRPGISRRRAVASWRCGQQHHDRLRDLLADQGDTNDTPATPIDRQEPGQRGVDRGVREPGPAEPAERDPGVDELDQHPAAGRRQRPPAQGGDQAGGSARAARRTGPRRRSAARRPSCRGRGSS